MRLLRKTFGMVKHMIPDQMPEEMLDVLEKQTKWDIKSGFFNPLFYSDLDL